MFRRAPLLLIVLLLAPSAALAEVVLTPTVGFRVGGQVKPTDGSTQTLAPTLAYGLTLDVKLAPEKWITVLWSRRSADFDTPASLFGSTTFGMNVDYLQVGGVYRPERGKRVSAFVMAAGGITWVDPEPGGFGGEVGVSGLIGGGWVIPINERLGFRIDARGIVNFTNVTVSGVCGGVGCSVSFTSGGALQFEGLGGLAIRF